MKMVTFRKTKSGTLRNDLHIFQWEDIKNDFRESEMPSLSNPQIIIFNTGNNSGVNDFSYNIFSDTELERAKQFHFESGRKEFLMARGILRFVISRLFFLSPEKIIFEADNREKPHLLNPECAEIDVNISHAGGWVVFAIIKDGQIGVDIEDIAARSNLNIKSLAPRIFSANEITISEQLSDSEFPKFFFRGWTRKEAILKAAGIGLSVDPITVEVFRSSSGGLEEISNVLLNDQMWNCFSYSPAHDVELSIAFSKK